MRLMHGNLGRLMRKRKATLVATLACMVWMQSAMADPDAERESLARLIHEIETLAR